MAGRDERRGLSVWASVERAAHQVDRFVTTDAEGTLLLDVLVRSLPRRLADAVAADHAAGTSPGLDDTEGLQLAVGARDGVGGESEVGGEPTYGRQLRPRVSSPASTWARTCSRTCSYGGTGESWSTVITPPTLSSEPLLGTPYA